MLSGLDIVNLESSDIRGVSLSVHGSSSQLIWPQVVLKGGYSTQTNQCKFT